MSCVLFLQEDFIYTMTKFPEVGCSYVPPDQCSDSTPPPCCERINAVQDAGVVLRASVAVLLVLCIVAAILG